MEREPTDAASFDVSAFAWAFGPIAAGSLVLMVSLFFDSSSVAFVFAMYGAMTWVLAVAALVLYGLVELVIGRWDSAMSRLLGVVSGALVGFGICYGVLGT